MIRILPGIGSLFAALALLPVGVHAQKPAAPAEAEVNDEKAVTPETSLIVRVYPVADLLARAPEYAYEGTYLPALRVKQGGFSFGPSSEPHYVGGMIGGGVPVQGGGGMGGMGGGGMGGGMFQVPAEGNTGPLFQRGQAVSGPGARKIRPVGELLELITSIVEPTMWDEVGGPGGIHTFAGTLVVSQTADVHDGIKDLLDQLRKESHGPSSLTIRAQWLALSAVELAGLRTRAGEKKKSSSGTLDRQSIVNLPDTARRFDGQITCFNGQTVYIISGRMETFLQGGIPVSSGGTPAYQVNLLSPQFGALLQVTPSATSDDQHVQLDLRSSVTRLDESGKPVTLQSLAPDRTGEPVVQVDRLSVSAQQFATSVRVPLGAPMLVGGMTFPGHGANEPVEQLYLIVEVEGQD